MVIALAHLSDPHITTGPLSAAPADALYRALGRALSLDPAASAFVITGDLVDRGQPGEYKTLHELIERFPRPVYLLPGNHDDTGAFLEVFGGTRFVAGADRSHYRVADPDFTLVCLDSAVTGSPAGRLDDAQLDFLDRALAERPEVPAFVALHHPPVDLGMPFLDGMRLCDNEHLLSVLERHHNVVRVLAGHVHRHVTAAVSRTLLTTAPSTHLQSRLVLTDDVPNYVEEPASFLLHVQHNGQWITHAVNTSHARSDVVLF